MTEKEHKELNETLNQMFVEIMKIKEITKIIAGISGIDINQEDWKNY